MELVGIWDGKKANVTLGGLLLFVEELLTIRQTRRPDRLSLMFTTPIPSILANILHAIEGVDGVSMDLPQSNTFLWPDPKNNDYIYGRTVHIQQFFSIHGSIPALSFKKEVNEHARQFLASYIAGCLPIVVHLKNVGGGKGKSNADQKIWYAFFSKCTKKPMKFFLIGDDSIDCHITALPNVVHTRAHGATLLLDLALISVSQFFLGMVSGPANVAICSKVPYILYKDPTHNSGEMKEEIGDCDQYIFATSHQFLFRRTVTLDHLFTQFSRIAAMI